MTTQTNHIFARSVAIFSPVWMNTLSSLVTGNVSNAQSHNAAATVWEIFTIPPESTLAERAQVVLWDRDKRVKESLAAFMKNDDHGVGR